MGIGYIALWGFGAKCWLGDGWSGWVIPLRLFTTTGAPAVLTNHLQDQVLNRAVAPNGKGDVGWHSELSSIEAPHEENLHRFKVKVEVKKVENYLAGCSAWTSWTWRLKARLAKAARVEELRRVSKIPPHLPPQFQRFVASPLTGELQPMTIKWCTCVGFDILGEIFSRYLTNWNVTDRVPGGKRGEGGDVQFRGRVDSHSRTEVGLALHQNL